MSSIKDLKRKIKGMVIAVLDECDYVMANNDKKADAADKLIDEAVDFHDAMISKIGQAKSKADYRAIREEVSKNEVDFVKKLNKLQ